MQTDVIVLGAGMVGISAALHLQQRGRAVALVDRRGPAEETSYGNAGLVQREGIVPYGFPQKLRDILKYSLNRSPEARYHLAALPRIAPALYRYWRASTPERIAASARAARPLVERCLTEHQSLMDQAGVSTAMRPVGWLKVFRDARKYAAERAVDEADCKTYGIAMQALDHDGIIALEPHLLGRFAGGIHMTQPGHVADPGALGQAYAGLFERLGGKLLKGDARSLQSSGSGWSVATNSGQVTAREAVVALGPWSGELMQGLGYTVPMFVKRGYHMHYRAAGNATLNRTVIDGENGFVMGAMSRGIRVTTGAEFGLIETPATPAQLDQVEPIARSIFPLTERVDAEPWLGRRPCLPDMLPVIGHAGRHKGLWLDFGHHHLGFTLGPVSGLLLAQMMTGDEPFTDPAPYRLDRF